MAQLATSLVPLLPDTDAAVARFTEQVHDMPRQIRAAWLACFGAKVGLQDPQPEDHELIAGLLQMMQQSGSDFTNTFRSLADDPETFDEHITNRDEAREWRSRWKERLEDQAESQNIMRKANPIFIPRNHRIEEMINSAVAGDDAPFHRMLDVLSRPFEDRPDALDLKRPPLPDEQVHATFCGT